MAAEPFVLPVWQAAVRDAVRDADELARLLDLPAATLDALTDPKFGLLVPRGFVARMRRGDPNDPLLKQILPRPVERAHVDGFTHRIDVDTDALTYEGSPGGTAVVTSDDVTATVELDPCTGEWAVDVNEGEATLPVAR